MPGESPGASCSRLLKRELSLNIDPERFKPLCFNSMVWGMREQEPKTNGSLPHLRTPFAFAVWRESEQKRATTGTCD
eukprot:224285-Rhodomonas_salina.1